MYLFSQIVQTLYKYGARKVAMFGTGFLGCVPLQIAKYGATNGSACVQTINDASSLFDQKLKRLIDSINNHFVDATFIHTNSTATSYGMTINLVLGYFYFYFLCSNLSIFFLVH